MPADIVRHTVWLYARFTLSYRDVEERLAQRGLDISYETVRRWFLKFGSIIAANLRRGRPRPSDHWHLDEMVIVIQKKRYWLWRAVDNEGEVLDFLVQRRRNTKAARANQFESSGVVYVLYPKWWFVEFGSVRVN